MASADCPITIAVNGKPVVRMRDGRFLGPGRIGFQVHGGKWVPNMEIRIRKIRIRDLGAGAVLLQLRTPAAMEPRSAGPALAAEGTGGDPIERVCRRPTDTNIIRSGLARGFDGIRQDVTADEAEEESTPLGKGRTEPSHPGASEDVYEFEKGGGFQAVCGASAARMEIVGADRHGSARVAL